MRKERIRMVAPMVAFLSLLHLACTTSVDSPDPKAGHSLEYELALQRGTQAVIWILPTVSMKLFFKSMQDLGAGYQDIVYVSKPFVSRPA